MRESFESCGESFDKSYDFGGRGMITLVIACARALFFDGPLVVVRRIGLKELAIGKAAVVLALWLLKRIASVERRLIKYRGPPRPVAVLAAVHARCKRLHPIHGVINDNVLGRAA